MRTIITLLCSFCPASAVAAVGDQPDAFRAGLQMIAALGVVLGIFLLIFYLIRKRKLVPFGAAKGSSIKVIETRFLGPRKALYLVQVRGEYLLLGVCQDRIDLLTRPTAQDDNDFPGALKSALENQR
jgi:flagellar protein FliO/FliZ